MNVQIKNAIENGRLILLLGAGHLLMLRIKME